jgi:hypothetical protein
MSEVTHAVKIIPVRATETVLVELPNNVYMRMPADKARDFGMRLIAAAAKSEGKSGTEFLLEVPA